MTEASFLDSLHAWSNFYLLLGGAAATLSGLMFMAVTFGASLVTPETVELGRAFTAPTFSHFVHILVIAALMNVPTLSPRALGVLLALTAVGRIAILPWIYRHVAAAHRKAGDIELADWLSHLILPGLLFALLLIVAAGFVLGYPLAFAGLALFMLTLLVLAIQSAWETMLWIVTQVKT